MLATLVIGLREGLEAALIVGIIAAFLRKNGRSVRPMWTGVVLAVLLSIAVGVVLDVVEQSLPQSGQEAMESVIGAIAVFFVTTMIVWMSAHARNLRKDLEADAAAALTRGSAYALAVMAFLAVLKEGFETSVFLLATFSAAQSAATAAAGAVIGVLIAVGIGWGIYAGGVRLNLARFFRITGAFLILVAAGLTVTTLRTAHEAGWLNAGQEPTVNLSWLVSPGSLRSALITGVLGIPADPRLVEVLGWFAYLVPVALFVYWPRALRPRGAAVARLQFAVAAALAVAAVVLPVVLAVAVPAPQQPAATPALLLAAADQTTPPVGTAVLTTDTGTALRVSVPGSPDVTVALPADQAQQQQHAGVPATTWVVTDTTPPADAPTTVSLGQLTALSGGRVPVGLNPQQHPGPFTAQWATRQVTTVWAANGVLLDATRQTSQVVTVSGSGLQAPRTLSVDEPNAASDNWAVAAGYRDATAAALGRTTDADRSLWAVDVPVVLGVAALLFAAAGLRSLRRSRTTPGSPVPSRPPAAAQVELR